MSDKKPSARSYPKEPRIVITMSKNPKYMKFTRHLSFRNHNRKWARLPVAFRRTANLVWQSSDFPNGIDVLRSFVDTGNRDYWDSMYLENRGGRTELSIAHLLIEMNYDNPAGSSPTGLDHGCIPIVDAGFNQTLRAGRHCLSLNSCARTSRIRWAGLSGRLPAVVRRVVYDLGKSGSDGQDQDKYGKNPKYGGAIDYLCSEFASWYYFESGVRVAGQDFRDIIASQKMHDAFSDAKRLYYYRNADNTWRAVDRVGKKDAGKAYTPKAGDYLERRGPASAEHSMIVLRWNGDPAKKEAIVFNGPWPVTLRRVRIDHDERNNDKTFYVGRVDS